MTDVPAFVVGRRTDVLAWNPLGAALVADFRALSPRQRNFARLIFLDEHIGALFTDRRRKARDIVAFLCAVMFTVVWWFAADHGRPHYWAIFVALIVVSLLAAWYAGRGIWQAARSLVRAGRKDADKETG